MIFHDVMTSLLTCLFSFSLLHPNKYIGKRKDTAALTTIVSDNQQVKTYMDNSNGVRSANPNAYNKVRDRQTTHEHVCACQHILRNNSWNIYNLM